jgi:hypothetical protein
MVRFINIVIAWIFEHKANILIVFHLSWNSLPVLLVESFFSSHQILVILVRHL